MTHLDNDMLILIIFRPNSVSCRTVAKITSTKINQYRWEIRFIIQKYNSIFFLKVNKTKVVKMVVCKKTNIQL